MFDPADRLLLRRIWSLTWPTILSNALELSVGLVDLLLVSPFGPSATAAIGISRQVTFLVEAVVLAITASIITLISQGVGAEKNETRGGFSPSAVARQGFYLALLLGVPMSLLGYWLSPAIFLALKASAETLAHGEAYLRTYFAGIVLLWGNAVCIAIFRGSGDVTTPLKVTLISCLLQVGLSYLFIHGAGPVPVFGVQGTALGLVSARAFSLAVFLLLLRRRMPSLPPTPTLPHKGGGSNTFDRRTIAAMMRIGVPAALANVLRHGSRLVFLAIVGASAFGETLQAAIGVGLQMRLLSILPALAFQIASAILVGQAIGRGALDEAVSIGRRSVQLLTLIMVVVAGGIIVLADPLAALFMSTPEAARLGALVLRWFAVAQFFSALSIGLQGALLGAGDTMPAMRYTLLSEWCLLLPCSYLCVTLDWVPEGLLAAWAVAPALTAALMWRRFRSGRWLKASTPR